MVFNEFHDPHPPEPGMREFALVAERAQGIRRRRAAWATRVASVVLLVGGGLAVYQVSSGPHTTPSGPVATDATPSNTTTASDITASDSRPTLSLADAQAASALPPIALGPGLLTVSDDPLVEIFEATDGSTCTQAEVPVTTPTCAPAGAGFVVIGYGEGDAARVAVVVDPTVEVSFHAPDAECTQNFPAFAVVQVWVCAGFTADAATVEIEASDRIVIGD